MRKALTTIGITAAALAATAGAASASTSTDVVSPSLVDTEVNADHALQNAVQDIEVTDILQVGAVIPVDVDAENNATAPFASLLGNVVGGSQ